MSSFPHLQMVRLVRTGTEVNERSIGERLRFGCELQEAFKDFVGNFLPHMEEEEEVFQVGIPNCFSGTKESLQFNHKMPGCLHRHLVGNLYIVGQSINNHSLIICVFYYNFLNWPVL